MGPGEAGTRVARAGAALLLLSGCAGAPAWFGPNFHEVVRGRVYRSGQLSAAELEAAVARVGLRSIVNLRGRAPGAAWYEAEVAVARRLGLAHEDLDLSARRLPPQPAAARLVRLLETLPAPLLLHCGAGADRAGFAGATARIVLTGATLPEARDELSMAYGHLPFGPSSEMRRFFDLYAAHLARSGEPDRPATFRRWVDTAYVPYVYRARIEPLAFPAAAAPGARMTVRVRVTNLSPGAWRLSTSRLEGIKLGFRIRAEGEPRWRDFDRAGYLMRTVEPGDSLELAPPMLAPRAPGRYEIKIDLVDEHVTWFEDQGSRAVVRALVVD